MNQSEFATLAVMAGTAVYLLGHYFLSRARWAARLSATGDDREIAAQRASKISTGLLYLAASIGILSFSGQGYVTALLPRWPEPLAAKAAALVATLVLPVVYLFARRRAAEAHLPELRVKAWSRAAERASVLGWIVYLVGYEALFRGVLLVPIDPVMGLVPAVAVHTGLYALAHVHKGPAEAFGCLLVGPLFAAIALQDGSIQLVVLLHVAIALTAELTAGRRSLRD